MVAAAVVGSAVVGAGASIIGGGQAANAQKDAAANANGTQMAMFDKTQQNLKPYMNMGVAANNALMNLTGLSAPAATGYDNNAYNAALAAWQGGQGGGGAPLSKPEWLAQNPQYYGRGSLSSYNNYLSGGGGARGPMPQLSDYPITGSGTGNPLDSPLLKPISMDQASLEKTPGYQFNLTQGLKAIQSSAAARGLGLSGAAQKGAAGFATGLADSTYQNQFNNAVTNQTNQFNRLSSLQQGGQNAAAGLGGIGQQTASNIGNNLVGAGNAQAASYMNTANAIGNAGNSAVNGAFTNQLMQGMYGNGGNYGSAYTPAGGWTQAGVQSGF